MAGGETDADDAGLAGGDAGDAVLTVPSAVPHPTQNFMLSSFGEPQWVQNLVAIYPPSGRAHSRCPKYLFQFRELEAPRF